MSKQAFDAEKFNGEIRRFLKKVGISSQLEIEAAVRVALERGKLDTGRPLKARMVLEVESLGLRHAIEQDLDLH